MQESCAPEVCANCLCYRGFEAKDTIKPVLCVHGTYMPVNVPIPKKECSHFRLRRRLVSGSRRKMMQIA